MGIEARLLRLELRRRRPAGIDREYVEALRKWLRGESPEPPPPSRPSSRRVDLESTESLRAHIRWPEPPEVEDADYRKVDKEQPARLTGPIRTAPTDMYPPRGRLQPEPDRLQGYREDETYQRSIDELGLGE